MRHFSLWMLAPLALTVSCGSRPAEQRLEARQNPPVKVQTAVADFEDWPQEYSATGTVRARSSAVISSQVNGHVLEVRVREGDTVAAGQTLVVLDSRESEVGVRRAEAMRAEASSALPELEAAIEAAKSSLDLAEVTFRRMSGLYSQKSISSQEFDEAQARVKAARANYNMTVARRAQIHSRIDRAEQEVASASIDKGYSRIAAPFAGIVTVRSVEPGALATVGTPLLTVERGGAYQLEASVEESKARSIRVGHPAQYSLDAGGCEGSAKVSEVVPAVDPMSRSYLVKIPLPCAGIRSGMFGRAMFPQGVRRVLLLPQSAVVTKGQLQSVFVVDGQVAHARLVTAGETRGGKTEVLSGLGAGERVVLAPAPQLGDGSAVEARP